jgi:hypothetical protein
MDPTALYYALSTIAQCAAALAALIGFLGMWRLDRLQEEQSRILQLFQEVQGGFLVEDLIRHGTEYYVQRAKERAKPESALARAVERYDALLGTQRLLLWVLRGFLVVTLIILGAAVVGFLYVDQAKDWARQAVLFRAQRRHAAHHHRRRRRARPGPARQGRPGDPASTHRLRRQHGRRPHGGRAAPAVALGGRGDGFMAVRLDAVT